MKQALEKGTRVGRQGLAHTERYRRKVAPNGAAVGMMISKATLALQRLKVKLRGALCLAYLDVDMKNAHPVCLVSVFGNDIPTMADYVKRRATWIAAVKGLHPKRSTSEIKDLFRAAVNRHDPRQMYTRWCWHLREEPHGSNNEWVKRCATMGQELLALRSRVSKWWPQWDPTKKDTTNFANLMATLTQDAVMITVKVLETHGWSVDAIVADGVHVQRQHAKYPNIEAIAEEVRQITGWSEFGLSVKPFQVDEGMPVGEVSVDTTAPCCTRCTAAEQGIPPQSRGAWQRTQWVAPACAVAGCSELRKPGYRRCVAHFGGSDARAADGQGGLVLPGTTGDSAGAERLTVSTTWLQQRWQLWKRLGQDPQGKTADEFMRATAAALQQLGGRVAGSKLGAVRIHPWIENWICEVLAVAVQRCTTFVAYNPVFSRATTAGKGAGGRWARVLNDSVSEEQDDAADWRATSSYLAVDLDTAEGARRAAWVAKCMTEGHGAAVQSRTPGYAVMLMVAGDFTAARAGVDIPKLVADRAGMELLMTIPGGRIPVGSVGAAYTHSKGGVMSRAWGSCEPRESRLVICRCAADVRAEQATTDVAAGA